MAYRKGWNGSCRPGSFPVYSSYATWTVSRIKTHKKPTEGLSGAALSVACLI